ncbi:MAG: hypothetical protein SGILL_006423, partial [Bacillariaceae sp.]
LEETLVAAKQQLDESNAKLAKSEEQLLLAQSHRDEFEILNDETLANSEEQHRLAQAQIEELKTTYAQTSTRLEEASARVTELVSFNKEQSLKFDEERTTLQAEAIRYQRELVIAVQEKKDLQEQLSASETNVSSVQSDLIQSKTENETLKKNAKGLEARQASSMAKLNAATKELQDLQKAKADVEESMKRLDLKHSVALAKLEDHSVAKGDAKILLQMADKTKTEICEKLLAAETNFEQSQKNVGELQLEIERLSSERSSLVSSHSDTAELLNITKQEKIELAKKIEEAEKEKHTATQETTVLLEEMNELKIKHSTELASRVKSVEDERDTAARDLAAMQTHVAELEARHQAETVAQLREAEEKNATVTEDLVRVTSQIAELKSLHVAGMGEFQQQSASAQQRVESITAEFDSYRSDVSRALDGLAEEVSGRLRQGPPSPSSASRSQSGGEQSRQGTSAVDIATQQAKIERIKTMLGSLQPESPDRGIASVSSMQSQNEEAADMIQTISAQLKNKNQKYKALKKQVLKLCSLHSTMEGKVLALRQESNSLRDAKNLQATIGELQLLFEDVTALAENAAHSSSRSVSSVFSGGSMTTFHMQDSPNRARTLETHQEEEGLDETLIEKAAVSVQWKFETDLAVYEVRRPWYIGKKSVFDSLTTKMALDTYASQVQPTNPSSLEIAAKLKAGGDGSLLILSGENNVQHRQGGSSKKWADFGNVDVLDRPLGWEADCSLDQVLEEAHLYRQQCCQSLFRLTLPSPKSGIKEMMNLPKLAVLISVLSLVLYRIPGVFS